MKLNADCIRDVLLEIEKASFGEHITNETLAANLTQWSMDEISYTCVQLANADYLQIERIKYIRYEEICVLDITYKGHEFLDAIRDDSVWHKVLAGAKKAGAFGLGALADIAKEVVSKKLFGA